MASLGMAYIPKSIVITLVWFYQCYRILKETGGVIVNKVAAEAVGAVPEITYTLVPLPVFPDLGTGDIIGLLGSMLGIAAMRSWDKKNGTETNSIGAKK